MSAKNRSRFGNVRPLPSGRFQARWTGPDGHIHKAPDTFATRDQAETWLAGQKVARAMGQWVDERDGAMTLDALAAQWKRETGHKRPSTLARDYGYLERYISPRFGTWPLAALDTSAIAAWVSEMRADELAPATIRKAVQILGQILALAVRDRRLLENPARASGLSLPRVEAPELRVLCDAEVDRLAGAIDPRYRALVIVGCETGLRFGELTALVAGDVDLLRRQITVTRNAVEVSGHLHHGQVKTKAGRRIVPLSAKAVEALTPLVGGVSHRDDLLFTAPRGGYLRLAGWRTKFWLPATKAAGLDGFRIHDMRHTAVSLWLAAGIDPKAIAAWAGHRSIATVLDRYGHLRPDQTAEYLARIDARRSN